MIEASFKPHLLVSLGFICHLAVYIPLYIFPTSKNKIGYIWPLLLFMRSLAFLRQSYSGLGIKGLDQHPVFSIIIAAENWNRHI